MQGYKLTFYTHQGRRYKGMSVAEWLLKLARDLDIEGATLFAAQAGYGRDGRIYSIAFLDLAEQPQEVVMAVTKEDADRIFAAIESAGVSVFYTRVPVEFGCTGKGCTE